jgi:hypothetical protein
MDLLLRRDPSDAVCTIGRLFVNGVFECFTLEDIVRDGPKVQNQTAIPPGRYRVDITHSPHFDRMLPLLVDVPGFTGIRIHAGNTAGDTDGCVLVGGSRAHDSIRGSQLALAALQPKIASAAARDEPVWIEVLNAERTTP